MSASGTVLETAQGDVVVTPADGAGDLDGILALQRANLATSLTDDAAARDGFVTVVHTREILEKMHAEQPSVVARHGAKVVGYALTMTRECRSFLPILEPMFALFESIAYRGAPLVGARFYVMGQICIADRFRGAGLFDAMYALHRAAFRDRYDLLVTEVSQRNGRSLRAHARVGFETLGKYRDATDEWVVIGLPLDR
jgi:L-amino acid N-acyltransferase YncA